MSVLSRQSIFKAIEAGDIKIEPYDEAHVGPASVDLTLSKDFRFFIPGRSVIDLNEDTDYKDITSKATLKGGDSFLLQPGQACLGMTEEKITLAPSICGLLGVWCLCVMGSP